MAADHHELMLIFGAMHVVALVLGGVLFVMLLRAPTTDAWQPPPDEEDDGGGGGNDRRRRPEPPSPGGIPLPLGEAAPARMRLRDHGRLADAHHRGRRPVHPPRRTPHRVP